MQQLQQPLANLSGRCKLPITLPQLMGLMQAAQQQGRRRAAFARPLQTAQTIGVPGAGLAGAITGRPRRTSGRSPELRQPSPASTGAPAVAVRR